MFSMYFLYLAKFEHDNGLYLNYFLPERKPNVAISCATPVVNALIPIPREATQPPINIVNPHPKCPIKRLANGPTTRKVYCFILF